MQQAQLSDVIVRGSVEASKAKQSINSRKKQKCRNAKFTRKTIENMPKKPIKA